MKALVTGGGGFLGSNLVRALLARGDTVRVLARGDYPALRALGAETVRGDVTDAAATARACDGMDVVFHTAAKAGVWGGRKEYEAINVTGTQNVVDGCRAAKVPVLVHTSSPGVVHVDDDLEGVDESFPYSTHFTAHYPRTKALAEQLARAASNDTLKVVALRPHFIWGPGDSHILPRLLVRFRAGRLRRIGSRDAKCDTVYIDNCVHAHLLAADRLRAGAPIGGKTYFISDDQPIGVWTMVDRLLASAGSGPVTRTLPAGVVYFASAILEAVHWLFWRDVEPVMTRYAASQFNRAHWFNIGAARRDLGYAPVVSLDEGLRRLAESHARTSATTRSSESHSSSASTAT